MKAALYDLVGQVWRRAPWQLPCRRTSSSQPTPWVLERYWAGGREPIDNLLVMA